MVLLSELQRIYPRYRYLIIPVVIGALGTVTYNLEENLKKATTEEDNCGPNYQENTKNRALIGTMKIAKTTLNMWLHMQVICPRELRLGQI